MRLTCDEALEERLVCQVFIMLFEVLPGRHDQLHGSKLVASQLSALFGFSRITSANAIPSLLKSGNDITDEPTLPARLASLSRLVIRISMPEHHPA